MKKDFNLKYKFNIKGKELFLYIKKLTNMCYMFSNCSSLISIDLSNFNINNVEDMNHIPLKVLL